MKIELMSELRTEPDTATVRVVIADDHPVVRAGMRALLETSPGFTVVAEAADGAAAVATATAERPDVVLMDLRMPGLDGVAATEQIRRELPEVQVLVLTTYETDADIVRAVEAGATGYLLKDTDTATLLAGIRAAARGETVLAPSVAARLMARVRHREEALTPRELQVLAAVGRGLSNAAIGTELFISEATVKTHLLRIFTKLGVDDRTRAVTAAIEAGLIEPGASR